ncbi:MAG: hypothetical protein RIS47_785 [Bacteroidota bacterium]
MALLFESLTIKDVTFRNRIGISPMCTYIAQDGHATDWHLVHLGSRALGGAGLLIQEATAVSPEGRISPGDLGIYADSQVPMLQRINAFLLENGAVPAIQLAHAGRKASCAEAWRGGQLLSLDQGGWLTVAPSAVPFNAGERAPEALDQQGIDKVLADFASAARRSLAAGFRVIEIHAAHGYLIHQFFSPLSNLRTDSYGGSFENRIRFMLQVVEAIQSEWPANLPLFVRLSASEWADGGWNIDEVVQLCTILKTRGVDLIDTSAGGGVPNPKINIFPGYQVPFAERIRRECGLATAAVGLITKAQQAEDILQSGSADLILIARESLRDPNFPIHAAIELGVKPDLPAPYLRAF